MNGTTFRDLRTKMHLSQAELAHKIDVSTSTVRNIESSESVKDKYVEAILQLSKPPALSLVLPLPPLGAPPSADSLAAYNAAVAAIATLYRLAKLGAAHAPGRPRMTALDVLERDIAAAQAKQEAAALKHARQRYAVELESARRTRALYDKWTTWRRDGKESAIFAEAQELATASSRADWENPWNWRLTDFVSSVFASRVILQPDDAEWGKLFLDPEPVA